MATGSFSRARLRLKARKALTIVGVIVAIFSTPTIRPASSSENSDEGVAKKDVRLNLAFEERIVAGGPDDFMEVRHLLLTGSNYEIGKKLGELAAQHHGIEWTPGKQSLRNRAQRLYMARNFPIFLERMRGAAAAFGISLEESQSAGDSLSYLLGNPGCSVVYYPPSVTQEKVGYLSRNYDFTTGTIDGRKPGPGELPCTARPYVIELHPDQGYSSVYLCSYDLLGGTIDGINSEGLTVALLADDELNREFPMEPAGSSGVGLGVLQVPRLLLDTCANVEEAKRALLLNKQYYGHIPCHYIVADRHGKSFVWEYSQAHNREYIIDGDGKPQITTNFSLHRYPDLNSLPKEGHRLGYFNRYRTLQEKIEQAGNDLGLETIKKTNICVSPDSPLTGGRPGGRTLWHSLYSPEKRSLEVDFYLGEDTDPKTGETQIRRSGYVSFGLKKESIAVAETPITRARAAAIQKTRSQLDELIAMNGGIEGISEKVAPFSSRVEVLFESDKKRGAKMFSNGNHLYNIRYTLAALKEPWVGEKQGKNSQEPVDVIIDFSKQLKTLGVDLIVVPIPSKIEAHVSRFDPSLPVNFPLSRGRIKVMQRLLAADVEVIDPLPALLKVEALGEEVYETQGHHVSGVGAKHLGDLIGERLDRYRLKERDKGAFTNSKRESREQRNRKISMWAWPVEYREEEYRHVKDSPIVTIGDCNVFIYGSASLSSHIARASGVPVTDLGASASGAKSHAILAKKGSEWVQERKAVVWIMTSAYMQFAKWLPAYFVR